MTRWRVFGFTSRAALTFYFQLESPIARLGNILVNQLTEFSAPTGSVRVFGTHRLSRASQVWAVDPFRGIRTPWHEGRSDAPRSQTDSK